MKIATIRDVPINIHWTFLLLVGLLGFIVFSIEDDLFAAAYAVGIILVVFFFVLVHELAHVATARRYGVPTREITLHPLGGISMMERMPEQPKQEAAVSAVGPATNLAWAILLAPLIWHLHGPDLLYTPRLLRLDQLSFATFLVDMYWINIIMGVFNLLPAFPLDGGRVLRAALAIKMSHVRATKVAADFGRFFGILFALAGLLVFPNLFLVLIGIFVYFGASAEERSATTMAVFSGANVRDAMRTEFHTVGPDTPVDELVETSYRTHQMDLPVVDGDHFLGLVDRNTLSSALGMEGRTAGDVMRTDMPRLSADQDLASAFRRFTNSRLKALPVVAPEGEPADETRDEPAPLSEVGEEGRTATGKVSWAKVPGERPRDGRIVGLLTIEDMERAYLYITQRERVGQHTRIASPFDMSRKRRLPRGEGTRVSRERPKDAEEWVPVGRNE